MRIYGLQCDTLRLESEVTIAISLWTSSHQTVARTMVFARSLVCETTDMPNLHVARYNAML